MSGQLGLRDDHLSPDCRDGKHSVCRGGAWCVITDDAHACDCSCHAAVAS